MSLSITKSRKEDKQYNVKTEWGRLFSFSKFSFSFDVSAINLAKCGFYLSNNDVLMCYSCGVIIKEWQTSLERPSEIHKKLSPDCLHVNGHFFKESTIYGSKAVFSQIYSVDNVTQSTPICTLNANDAATLNSKDAPLSIQDSFASYSEVKSEQTSQIVNFKLNNHSNKNSHNSTTVSENENVSTWSKGQRPRSAVAEGNADSSSSIFEKNVHDVISKVPHSTPNTPIDIKDCANNSDLTISQLSPKKLSKRSQQSTDAASVLTQDENNKITSTSTTQKSLLKNDGLFQNNPSRNISKPHTQTQLYRSPDFAIKSTVPKFEYENRSSDSYTQLPGVIVKNLKYPKYVELGTRVKSFNEWQLRHSISPLDIAEAGFFFVGHADYTRCFFCGGGLKNWEPGDDPWVEHARWFQKCTFLIMKKGNHFIQCVQEAVKEAEKAESSTREAVNSSNTRKPVQETSENGDAEQIWNLEAIVAVLKKGYSKDEVQTAIHSLGKAANELSTNELMAEIEDKLEKDSGIATSSSDGTSTRNDNEDNLLDTLNQDDYETALLVKERDTLKRMQLCSVCGNKERACVFLPCGHFTCCRDCAPAMKKCSTCHCLIQGVIRTFAS